MKSRNVAALGWASLITILAGLWVVFGEHPGLNYGGRGQLFFEREQPNIDGVALIRFYRGHNELILYRDGGRWVLSSHGNYPANQEKVQALFKAFKTSTRREPITKFQMRSDSHGLESEDTLYMDLINQVGEVIEFYAIGHRVEGAEGRSLTYIWAGFDSRAWLTTDLPALSDNVADWMDSELLALDPSEVIALSLDGQALALPNGDQAVERALSALVQLQAVDVVKVDSLLEPLAAPVRRFTLETAGGKSIAVRLFERGAEIWVSLESAGGPLEQIAADTATGALTETEAGAEVASGADVHGTTNKLEGRIFKVPQQTASTLMAPLAGN